MQINQSIFTTNRSVNRFSSGRIERDDRRIDGKQHKHDKQSEMEITLQAINTATDLLKLHSNKIIYITLVASVY